MWFRNKWYLSDGHAICLVIAGSPSLRLPTAVNLEGDRRKKRRVTPCQWCQLYSRKFKSSAAAFSRIKNLKDGWTAELYWPSTPLKGFDGANCVAPTLPTNPSTGHRCGWRQAAKTKRSYKITWLCFPIFSYYCLYFILLTLLPFMHTPKTLHAAPLHWRKRASMLNINVWCGAWSKIKTLSGKMTPHHVTEWIDDRPNCSIFPKGMRRLVPAQSGACVCVCVERLNVWFSNAFYPALWNHMWNFKRGKVNHTASTHLRPGIGGFEAWKIGSLQLQLPRFSAESPKTT